MSNQAEITINNKTYYVSRPRIESGVVLVNYAPVGSTVRYAYVTAKPGTVGAKVYAAAIKHFGTDVDALLAQVS